MTSRANENKSSLSYSTQSASTATAAAGDVKITAADDVPTLRGNEEEPLAMHHHAVNDVTVSCNDVQAKRGCESSANKTSSPVKSDLDILDSNASNATNTDASTVSKTPVVANTAENYESKTSVVANGADTITSKVPDVANGVDTLKNKTSVITNSADTVKNKAATVVNGHSSGQANGTQSSAQNHTEIEKLQNGVSNTTAESHSHWKNGELHDSMTANHGADGSLQLPDPAYDVTTGECNS